MPDEFSRVPGPGKISVAACRRQENAAMVRNSSCATCRSNGNRREHDVKQRWEPSGNPSWLPQSYSREDEITVCSALSQKEVRPTFHWCWLYAPATRTP